MPLFLHTVRRLKKYQAARRRTYNPPLWKVIFCNLDYVDFSLKNTCTLKKAKRISEFLPGKRHNFGPEHLDKINLILCK